MSETAIAPGRPAPLPVAAFFGWGAGVLAGFVVMAPLTLWNVASRTSVANSGWLGFAGNLAWILVLLAACGAMLSFPAPILAVAMMWPAERVWRHARRLPFWLATGVAASLPTAGFVWRGRTLVTAHDDGSLEPRYFLWANLQLPLLILACGLVGAFVAWRWRQARLAA